MKTKSKSVIITLICILICVVLLPLLIINVTLITKSFTNKDEVPNFGNLIPMIVLTDSMYPEINSGDLIILNKIETEKVKIGDIITFFEPSGKDTSAITHRVIEITTKDNKIAFKTKGDSNNTEDKELVTEEELIGIYKFKISGLGNIAIFMSTTKGLIICIAIPLILLFGYDIISRKKYDEKLKEDKEALIAELERLKAEKQK